MTFYIFSNRKVYILLVSRYILLRFCVTSKVDFEMKYKIQVRTIQERLLTFTVEKYEIDNGGFVCFTDRITKKDKKFHSSNCEIEVLD